MARTRRCWFRVLRGVLWLVLAYLAAVVGLMLIPVNRNFREATGPEAISLFVATNGVHTDLILPIQHGNIDWAAWWGLPAAASGATHVAMGWGNREFYLESPTWADLRATTALRAAAGLGKSAMHVSWLAGTPLPSRECREIRVDLPTAAALAAFIQNSAYISQSGHPQPTPEPGYTPEDAFFEANGRYSVLNTCNTWTGRALAHAGVKVSFWTPYPSGVFWHLPEP